MIKKILEHNGVKHRMFLLQKAEKILKEEFVGVDGVIDCIITNLRPWYLYPDFQDKPLVLPLIGLTGTGRL